MSDQPFPVQRNRCQLISKGMSTFSYSGYSKLPGSLTFKPFLEIEETMSSF